MHLNILTFFSISVETQAFRHTQVVIGGPIITHNNNNTRRRRELTIFLDTYGIIGTEQGFFFDLVGGHTFPQLSTSSLGYRF